MPDFGNSHLFVIVLRSRYIQVILCLRQMSGLDELRDLRPLIHQ